MSNYTPTGAPADQTRGASATIRSELQTVATAIATKSDTAGEIYSGTHDFTGGAVIVATQASSDTSTKSASTEFVQNVVLMAGIDPIAHQIATQFEMENGTEAALRLMSPLRVKQAIQATASLPGHTHSGVYEPVLTVATQAEMEEGTVGSLRSVSPLRVKQAILSLSPVPMLAYSSRTSNAQLAATDKGRFIDITSGTFTQTFTAAATLGAGWWCYIRNVGTGVITLDPNASETIDGVTSGVIVAGDTYLVICTGTAFITERRQNGPMRIELKTSSGSWTAPLGVRNARVTVVGGGGGGASGTNYTGSGGGTAIKTFTVQPGTSYSYVVGAAGAISYGSGGDSSFTGSTTITGSGGTSTYTAVVGGAASGGDVNIPGGPAAVYSGDHLISGDSMYGFGAIGASNNRPASGYGGGGGAWQNGTQGCVIIEY